MSLNLPLGSSLRCSRRKTVILFLRFQAHAQAVSAWVGIKVFCVPAHKLGEKRVQSVWTLVAISTLCGRFLAKIKVALCPSRWWTYDDKKHLRLPIFYLGCGSFHCLCLVQISNVIRKVKLQYISFFVRGRKRYAPDRQLSLIITTRTFRFSSPHPQQLGASRN